MEISVNNLTNSNLILKVSKTNMYDKHIQNIYTCTVHKGLVLNPYSVVDDH